MFDFGVSWSPNAEILKQSSEVAILKTYDLKFTAVIGFLDITISGVSVTNGSVTEVGEIVIPL